MSTQGYPMPIATVPPKKVAHLVTRFSFLAKGYYHDDDYSTR